MPRGEWAPPSERAEEFGPQFWETAPGKKAGTAVSRPAWKARTLLAAHKRHRNALFGLSGTKWELLSGSALRRAQAASVDSDDDDGNVLGGGDDDDDAATGPSPSVAAAPPPAVDNDPPEVREASRAMAQSLGFGGGLGDLVA